MALGSEASRQWSNSKGLCLPRLARGQRTGSQQGWTGACRVTLRALAAQPGEDAPAVAASLHCVEAPICFRSPSEGMQGPPPPLTLLPVPRLLFSWIFKTCPAPGSQTRHMLSALLPETLLPHFLLGLANSISSGSLRVGCPRSPPPPHQRPLPCVTTCPMPSPTPSWKC